MTDHTSSEKRIAGLTETQFNDKNATYGGRLKILTATVQEGGQDVEVDIIVRPPTRPEYDKHTQDMLKVRGRPDILSTAGPNLVRNCLIAPSVDEFNLIHDRYPALADGFESELLKMAGAAAEVREKSFR